MHTEENQNKPRRRPGNPGKKAKPGEQVAYNKTLHCNMQLFENEVGEYYPVVDRLVQVTLVRGEYHPVGNRFHYPKQWGRKYAAKVLLEHKIGVQQAIIDSATDELSKLKRCLESIQDWSETDE